MKYESGLAHFFLCSPFWGGMQHAIGVPCASLISYAGRKYDDDYGVCNICVRF